jgi:glycosyltransferase involved in cell wall biosynthesis
MRIAFFNWRDIKNPMAGGAEVLNHQILKHLGNQGHKITMFTSSFPGCSEREVIDNIEHIRYGGKFLIYPKAYFCYQKYIEGNYDVIVESINGVPFFTQLFAKENVISLVHQLTRENWYSGIALPFAFIGYHAEDAMLGLYRKNPTIVPSKSTKTDLEKLGFKNVTIIHGAADIALPKEIIKEKNPTVIYLGRLTKSKRVDHVLRAFMIIKASLKDPQLWIVGSGPQEKKLIKLANELGITDSTKFFGKVSQEKKAELFSRSHIKLFPAVREGWGLVVLEANACGTPVIGYNVKGLCDSIQENVNGVLVNDGDIQSMAKCTIELLKNYEKLNQLSMSSLDYSKRFSWEKSAQKFIDFLGAVCNE